MSVYLVVGTVPYRDHLPGETFEAFIEPDAEMRAVLRGNIRIIDSSPTRLRPGSYTPPNGWHINDTTEAPQGASSIEGSQ